MQKLRIVMFVCALAAVTLACALGGTPAAPGENVATAVAATMQALTPAIPQATATAPQEQPTAAQGVPVTYKNVSFVIPKGLASDAAPQTVPAMTEEQGGPWGMAPEHVEFRLNHYAVSGGFSTQAIAVYPAQEYANANAGASIALQRLQAALGDPSMVITSQNAPEVPFFNAAAMISAQVQRVNFQNGAGIRMITQYGQAVMPIANDSTFYQFIGLTNDGKYLIVAVLPVKASILQETANPSGALPAGGVTFPDFQTSDAPAFEAYFKAVTEKLNSADAGVFQPPLATLDALVQSLSVGP